jgi:predicted phage terminase large subunit-like protein
MVLLEDGTAHECEQMRLPDVFDEIVSSWDLSFKAKRTSSFVAGHIWARDRSRRFLVDRFHGRVDYVTSKAEFLKLNQEWPGLHAHLVEDKANGSALLSDLQEDVAGMLPVEPGGDKAERLYATQPQWKAGNVYLPHPHECTWSEEVRQELITMPNSAHSDDADATSQALNWFRAPKEEEWVLV